MALFHFNHAIVRAPGLSVVNGLRAIDRGAPTTAGVEKEHAAYVAALTKAGVSVEILPKLEEFPDAIFVEDPALVFPEGAILLRPGAPSRLGEAAALAPALHSRFERVLALDQGFAEGGDVLITPRAVFIGLSSRTDATGAEGLKLLLAELGKRGDIVATPAGVLHFKTDCSLLDDETILSTRRLASSRAFQGFRLILTPGGEEAAANAIRVNDHVLVGDRFPRTIDLLLSKGYHVVPLPNEQIALLDAGFSCLSLRWNGSADAN